MRFPRILINVILVLSSWLGLIYLYLSLFSSQPDIFSILFLQLFSLPVIVSALLGVGWYIGTVTLGCSWTVLMLMNYSKTTASDSLLSHPMVLIVSILPLLLIGTVMGMVVAWKNLERKSVWNKWQQELVNLGKANHLLEHSSSNMEELRKENLRYTTMIMNLTHFSKLLNENLKQIEIIKTSMKSVRKYFETEYCAFYSVIPDASLLKLEAEDGVSTNKRLSAEIKFGDGIIGKSATYQQIVKITKDGNEGSAHPDVSHEYYLAIPIVYLHSLRGVLYIEKRMVFQQDLSMMMETLASFIGMALHNAALMESKYTESITDGLTKLYNHAYFLERLRESVAGAKRYGRPISILMMDVDHFKHYNDTNGHPMGDVVLEDVARLIKTNTRASDIACRYGGEEFVVILTETDAGGGRIAAEKIRRAIEEYHFENGESQPLGKVSISCGLSCLTEKIGSPEELMELADQCLYQAKENGRNQLVVYGDIL